MAFIISLCGACRPAADENLTLSLVSIDSVWANGQLDVRAGIRWDPPAPVIEALEQGVGIPLEVTVRVARHFGWVALEDRSTTYRLVIRFQPLLNDYELFEPDVGTRTRHRRWFMLLEALAEPRVLSTGLLSDEFRRQRWQVQLRAELDRSSLPSPMRLPAWFEPAWQARTAWHTLVIAQPDDDD